MSDKNSTAPCGATSNTIAEFRRARAVENRSAEGVTDSPSRVEADPIHTTKYVPDYPAQRRLYAIIDSVTDTIVGGVQIHINDASALRTLYDVVHADTAVRKHPLDFDLWMIGMLTNDHRVVPNKVKIVSGAQIDAMANPPQKETK